MRLQLEFDNESHLCFIPFTNSRMLYLEHWHKELNLHLITNLKPELAKTINLYKNIACKNQGNPSQLWKTDSRQQLTKTNIKNSF